MYIPASNRMANLESEHAFIQQFGFAVVVGNDLTATHIPLLLDKSRGDFGVLVGHMARANKHWEVLHGGTVLAIFSGPHAYISPTYYAEGPAVPTWNYAAVHATGKFTLVDEQRTLDIVEATTKKYEPKSELSHQRITDEIKKRLVKAIVGFEIVITDLQGKQKLGQQRSMADQNGVFRALKNSSKLEGRALAEYMEQVQLGMGNDY